MKDAETMTPDAETNPQVVAWRLTALEGKVDSLSAKVDALAAMVQKNLCPQPGACLTVIEGMKRLEAIVQTHEQQLQEVRLTMAKAGASVRTIIAIAGTSGSVLGVGISLLVQWLTK
jgi:hypothetical protein